VYYRIWSDAVTYLSEIYEEFDELKHQMIETWSEIQQRVTDQAIDQCKFTL